MTEPSLSTEPLRAEHRDLLPHLRGLETIADEVDRWNVDEAARVLGEIVGFLRGHLVPHAKAEEQVLYPAVEEAMAAPGATATMRADRLPHRPPSRHGGHRSGPMARPRRGPRPHPPTRGSVRHPLTALPQRGRSAAAGA